jgi:hypothetical protein
MKALISPLENNRICEIVNAEFPVALPLFFVDCPDETTSEWTFANGVFSAPLSKDISELKLEKAEAIKARRDLLTLNGGHKIGNDWYHSNEISLIQQLALNGIANQMVAAGAPDSTVIIATPWKTLSGAYVSLTVGIAKQFVQSALVQQGALFTAAQNKINEVNALTTVEQVQAYDVNAGFPAVYQA